MNIVFLDYDGVVNSLMFGEKKSEPYFNFPDDGKVNNYQAVKWLEKLCNEFNAKIVVTSTWRKEENYKECLYNGGLSKNIEIIGKTDDKGNRRIAEINRWLSSHPEVENYVILDDDFIEENNEHWIRTQTYIGMTYNDYIEARKIFI